MGLMLRRRNDTEKNTLLLLCSYYYYHKWGQDSWCEVNKAKASIKLDWRHVCNQGHNNTDLNHLSWGGHHLLKFGLGGFRTHCIDLYSRWWVKGGDSRLLSCPLLLCVTRQAVHSKADPAILPALITTLSSFEQHRKAADKMEVSCVLVLIVTCRNGLHLWLPWGQFDIQ